MRMASLAPPNRVALAENRGEAIIRPRPGFARYNVSYESALRSSSLKSLGLPVPRLAFMH